MNDSPAPRKASQTPVSAARRATNAARAAGMLICKACGAECGLWRTKVEVKKKGGLNRMARHLRDNTTCRITLGETRDELVANFRDSAF